MNIPEVDELPIPGGQPVVDNHLHPLSESPEPEPENAAVIAVEALLGCKYLVKIIPSAPSVQT